MQASPLAELKDIHLPEPTALWPPAIGWWALLVLLISLIIIVVVWRIRRWRLGMAKRKALVELSNLTSATQDWPQALQKLMRRLTISYYEQEKVAQLHGQSWVHFLVSQLKPSQQEKCKKPLQQLVDAQYQSSVELDFTVQAEAVKYWITNALPPKKKASSVEQSKDFSEAKENV
jgi:hypothetical protein